MVLALGIVCLQLGPWQKAQPVVLNQIESILCLAAAVVGAYASFLLYMKRYSYGDWTDVAAVGVFIAIGFSAGRVRKSAASRT